jgi:hypothetical protein
VARPSHRHGGRSAAIHAFIRRSPRTPSGKAVPTTKIITLISRNERN